MTATTEPVTYQGQFGAYQINEADRRSVVIYRLGLTIAALCFGLGTALVLWDKDHTIQLSWLSFLYTGFYLGLGISLLTIHIYLKPLHRMLQVFWLVGGVASAAIAHLDAAPFVLTVYRHPFTLLGVGFTFAALTGVFFKEAFCFDRLESKLLTFIVPALLLGHLTGWLPVVAERSLLIVWAILFGLFALRKLIQPIPPDIGDKSVFEYMQRQAS